MDFCNEQVQCDGVNSAGKRRKRQAENNDDGLNEVSVVRKITVAEDGSG